MTQRFSKPHPHDGRASCRDNLAPSLLLAVEGEVDLDRRVLLMLSARAGVATARVEEALDERLSSIGVPHSVATSETGCLTRNEKALNP
jgi:hypothetical protein